MEEESSAFDEQQAQQKKPIDYNINEEEKAKILASIEAIKEQFNQQDSLHHTIQENSAKLLDCKHEIVISLIAQVLAQDDVNLTIGTREICRQNYHIPVPAQVDYHHYLKGFFDLLENCMSDSAQQAYEETATTTQSPTSNDKDPSI